MIQDYSRSGLPARAPRRAWRRLGLLALASVLGSALTVSILVRSGDTQANIPATDPITLKLPAALADADRDIAGIAFDTSDDSTPAESDTDNGDWQQVTVRRGDTLSSIFDGLGLPATEWVKLLKAGDEVRRLTSLRVGEQLSVRTEGRKLLNLKLELDEARTLAVARQADGFEATIEAMPIETRTAWAMGRIDNSLFYDGAVAGLSDGMIMDLAHIFGYDIDWALDIRKGDRFVVVYEQLYRDGEKLRDGSILAAEFINQSRTLRAVRHVDSRGERAYYAPDGKSLKKAYIRTPLDVFRISSHFNPNRRHPVLNTIRAHKGTDYAAPTGTPIRATGDGKIVHRGNKGGYGRAVVIQHGTRFRTLYAHMSRFASGQRVGSRVRQGQVIGYVGSSGLATGAHLHYEFLVNGVHRNPVRVSLPRAEPIPSAERERFTAAIGPLLSQLDTLSQTQLAQLD